MNALIARMRAPRTLRSRVLRVLVPRVVAFLAFSAMLLVGQAMSFSPSAAPLDRLPSVVPTWSAPDRAAEPGCVPVADWPTGTPARAVVVHRFSDERIVRVDFDTAWKVNHNRTEADDLWVLGVCA